jgi:protein phosphatase
MDFFRRIFGQPKPEETSRPLTANAPSPTLSDHRIETAPSTSTKVAETAREDEALNGAIDENETTPGDALSPISPNAVTDQLIDRFQPEEETLRVAPKLAATPQPPTEIVPDGATRQLQPEKFMLSQSEHLIFGQATDIGMVRNNNQDAAVSFFSTGRSSEERPDFGLFVVADGMGGHQSGEKASAITARVMASQVMRDIYLPMLNGINDSDHLPITEALIAAVQKANADVLVSVPDGGTTLTAVVIVGDMAHVVHVGDSRVYLVTKDSIEQITRDHSLVQRLIELGHITRQDAADHNQKNVLYRAIGQSENLEVDTLTRRLPPAARLLLCSDGLWGQVEDDEIRAVVLENSPQEACDKLVKMANSRGGVDNITAIILKLPK